MLSLVIKNLSASTVGASALMPFQMYRPLVNSTGTGRLPAGAGCGTTSHFHGAPLSLTYFWIGRMLPGWLEYIASTPLLNAPLGAAPMGVAAFCLVANSAHMFSAATLGPSPRASFVRSLSSRSPPSVRRNET